LTLKGSLPLASLTLSFGHETKDAYTKGIQNKKGYPVDNAKVKVVEKIKLKKTDSKQKELSYDEERGGTPWEGRVQQ